MKFSGNFAATGERNARLAVRLSTEEHAAIAAEAEARGVTASELVRLALAALLAPAAPKPAPSFDPGLLERIGRALGVLHGGGRPIAPAPSSPRVVALEVPEAEADDEDAPPAPPWLDPYSSDDAWRRRR